MTSPLEIGATGGTLHDLLLGIQSGIGSLTRSLRKGDPAMGADPDGEGDGDPDGAGDGEGEGEGEGDPDGAGYDDLEQAVITGADGTQYVDGTVLIASLLRELSKANRLNVALARDMRTIKLGLASMNEDVLGPLAKAVIEGPGLGQDRAGAPKGTSAAGSARAAVSRHLNQPAATGGARAVFTSADLVKGMQAGVLDASQVRVFKRFGKFATDDAADTDVRARLTAALS